MSHQRNGIADYRHVLTAMRQVLERGQIDEWLPVLDRWIAELETLSAPSPALCDHLHRSWFATGGMGSLGDVVMAARPHMHSQQAEAERLDAELTGLVHRLYEITTDLSVQWACPPLSRARRPIR